MLLYYRFRKRGRLMLNPSGFSARYFALNVFRMMLKISSNQYMEDLFIYFRAYCPLDRLIFLFLVPFYLSMGFTMSFPSPSLWDPLLLLFRILNSNSKEILDKGKDYITIRKMFCKIIFQETCVSLFFYKLYLFLQFYSTIFFF